MSPRRKVHLPRDDSELVRQFNKESDRAAGILAFSYLDEVLNQALRTRLAGKEADELLGRMNTRTRLNLGVALRLVSLPLAKQVRSLLEIRNYFAHHVLDADSFDVEYVKSRVSSLVVVRALRKNRPKERPNIGVREGYLVSVWSAVWMIRDAAAPKRPPGGQ